MTCRKCDGNGTNIGSSHQPVPVHRDTGDGWKGSGRKWHAYNDKEPRQPAVLAVERAFGKSNGRYPWEEEVDA
jgi:hypothetical protein